jgi:hypothetical protein
VIEDIEELCVETENDVFSEGNLLGEVELIPASERVKFAVAVWPIATSIRGDCCAVKTWYRYLDLIGSGIQLRKEKSPAAVGLARANSP